LLSHRLSEMSSGRSGIEAIRFLQQHGITNPLRLVKLINDALSFLKLDLTGFTVLTEAASGPYVVTPIIAALSGAERVIALTRDSRFASAANVIAQTETLGALSGAKGNIEIHTGHSPDLFAQADIITNLGFVRPIDGETVAAMKPSAVIPLMCEAWEFRPGDVDLKACRGRGIPVLGTNEDYPGLEVFSYSGWLCLKMLFEAQIEVHKSRVLIVSSDKFGRVIERLLSSAGVAVRLFTDLREVDEEQLSRADALVVADYSREDVIIGPTGDLALNKLARLNRSLTVIQLAGRVDTHGLTENGITVYPGGALDARRMAMTLAELGPRPVVELHAAGLKVGEIALRERHLLPARLAANTQGLLQNVKPEDIKQ